jgi:hypothetical protein
VQLRPAFKQSLALPGLSASRLRLDFEAEAGRRWSLEVAYEHQVVSRFAGSGGSSAGLASQSASPYRLGAESEPIMDWGAPLSWRQNLDRAVLAYYGDSFDIRVGRQAIGLGRGSLFGAIDVFAPFSPLSVDREWRPGVDALHLDWRVSETMSVDLMAAASEGFAEGVALARIRGYWGDFDGALIGGHRAGDWVLAVVGSAAIGESSVYGEGAVYRTNGRGLLHGIFGSERWTSKAVVGAIHVWGVGAGLVGTLEYHFNGFGISDVFADAPSLIDPDVQARAARGDLQSLGRHQWGASLALMTDAEVQVGLGLTQSLLDGSGLAVPSLVWVVSDALTLTALASLPWGHPAGADGSLRSEYGGLPRSGLVQVAIYE